MRVMNCPWRDVNALSTIARIEEYQILKRAGFDTMTFRRRSSRTRIATFE